MSKFNNQSVIVTGAGSGIGKATALLLAQRGAKVVVSDIQVEGGNSTVAEINRLGGQAIFVEANVAKEEQVRQLVARCVEHFGSLDIMINNAGIGGPFAFLDQISNEDWNQIIAVNQTGVFFCMREALKVMKAQKKGNIVNVSSLAGISSAPRMGAYSASKHAVVGMTKTAAVEYAKYNIRVNAVCPSVIETPMGDSLAGVDPSVSEFLKNVIPMKRFGKAGEVASTIAWLCSEDASFITGSTIRVDGGHRA